MHQAFAGQQPLSRRHELDGGTAERDSLLLGRGYSVSTRSSARRPTETRRNGPQALTPAGGEKALLERLHARQDDDRRLELSARRRLRSIRGEANPVTGWIAVHRECGSNGWCYVLSKARCPLAFEQFTDPGLLIGTLRRPSQYDRPGHDFGRDRPVGPVRKTGVLCRPETW